MNAVSDLARQFADKIEEDRRLSQDEAEMFGLAEFSENAKVTITARVPEHILFMVDSVAAELGQTRSLIAAELIISAVMQVHGELVTAGLLKSLGDQATIERYVKWLEEKRS